MDHDRKLDQLVSLLEEHAITPAFEVDDFGGGTPWGHSLIYERVRTTPCFPLSADEVRAVLTTKRRGRE